ncbi:magnesium transporter CorA family protein [Gimesia sp.]|uniref:magnesium transporter CorA family protein n=1 Tax=Gimesia sp. TaxID=2024833 RepID=UPI003A8E3555
MLNVRIFGISDKSTLIPLPETALSASWQQDQENRWIDIEAASPEELKQLLAPLSLHPDILAACLDPQRSKRFISQRDALYLEIPTHLGWDQKEKPYLSILCLKTTIITIHRDQLHTVEDIINDLDGDVPLYAHNSSALLYYLLIQIGKCNVDAALEVREEAEVLDQACFDNPEDLDPKKISTLRRRVSHFAAVHDDHTYCAGVLQTVESEAFSVSQQANYFHEMLQLSELSSRIIAGAESRVSSLQRDYEAVVQNRVDSRLQFLTIISAVFLPLTLISGIYGMNFNDLPGMGVGSGYLVVLTFMLATVGITGTYFYWRGWFE